MNLPKTILLGVDLDSDGSLTEGCRAAADATKRIYESIKDLKIVLLHSTSRGEYWNPLKRGLVIMSQGITEAGRTTVDALASEFSQSGGSCEVVYSDDKPFLAVARAAQTHDVDLVVIGKHNKREHDVKKLGNVAKRILHLCPCSVLAVGAAPNKPQTLLAATDLTPVGAKAVRQAAWLADFHGAQLHVVHAYCFSMEDQIDPTCPREEAHEELRAAARTEIAAQLDPTGMQEKAEIHVGFGPPETVLLEAVAQLKPDAVVMGTVSRGGIAGFLTGNTAERMLDRIPCAILAVKPDDFESPVKP